MRGFILYRVSITQRLQSANRRSRFGHWETDTVISRKSKAVLLALVERRSRFFKIISLPNRKANTVAKATYLLLKGNTVRSMTSDNGKEFAAHRSLSKKLKAPFFFADPYSAWQRGSVENAIGLVRNFIPKKDDLKQYSHQWIAMIQNNINSRPYIFGNPVLVYTLTQSVAFSSLIRGSNYRDFQPQLDLYLRHC